MLGEATWYRFEDLMAHQLFRDNVSVLLRTLGGRCVTSSSLKEAPSLLDLAFQELWPCLDSLLRQNIAPSMQGSQEFDPYPPMKLEIEVRERRWISLELTEFSRPTQEIQAKA